jgi:hypothetical protein
VLERLEQKLGGNSDTGTVEDACKLLKISPRTLARRLKQWKQEVHYWHEGGKLVFDLKLLEDWQRHRNDPIAHQRAIEIRRSQLLSNQKKRRTT